MPVSLREIQPPTGITDPGYKKKRREDLPPGATLWLVLNLPVWSKTKSGYHGQVT